MNTLIKNAVLTIAGAGLVVCACFFIMDKQKNKIAYIDNARLFNEFLLKKELEEDLSKREIRWKAQLDSMRVQINFLGNKIESEKVSKEVAEQFEITRQQYLAKEEQFRNDNEKTARQFNEQIWKQLNTYVKAFAKEKEYDMVLGTSGEGNLMYADEKYDVTEEAIVFVNQKYKGKNG